MRRLLTALLFLITASLSAEVSKDWTTPLDPFKIADNLPGVTYVAIKGRPASYPGIEQDFEHTFATYKALPVDIFLGAHGVYFDMLPKLDKGARTNPKLWIDPAGYKAAIQQATDNYHHKLADQKASAK